ncbi:GNAT family N-acetyltransferase [Mesorhizobium sp. B2-8-5]|uniref:GNAT family N-acetyltransferase n=1 Tax=Mesorhizobium sp. B2-8-5 TaxID=2589903 RepID=UPI001D02AFC1|nr:GNAT family N-acetyltransferase [Mesorhizobium sp. B2-8-5]UCI28237.1 GNAT family N-acetyltransferase [Mesorhizobium sp. B2-8-5]
MSLAKVHWDCTKRSGSIQGLNIRLSAQADAKAQAADALYRYNVAATAVDDRAAIGAELCDDAGKVLGGLWGRTEMGLLFLDMFFLPEHLRGQSHGTRLLALVEAEAKRRGCSGAVVETSSFQAPGFYTRHGYQEFGRVDFGVGGHARIFLHRHLA